MDDTKQKQPDAADQQAELREAVINEISQEPVGKACAPESKSSSNLLPKLELTSENENDSEKNPEESPEENPEENHEQTQEEKEAAERREKALEDPEVKEFLKALQDVIKTGDLSEEFLELAKKIGLKSKDNPDYYYANRLSQIQIYHRGTCIPRRHLLLA